MPALTEQVLTVDRHSSFVSVALSFCYPMHSVFSALSGLLVRLLARSTRTCQAALRSVSASATCSVLEPMHFTFTHSYASLGIF